jgi:hypothetical protein
LTMDLSSFEVYTSSSTHYTGFGSVL